MFSYLILWLYSAMWPFCDTLGQKTVQAAPCLSGVINHYTPVLGFGCDSSTLQVGTLNGFNAGDKVLLIQMQVPQVDLSNTASFGTVLNTTCIGNYEFNRILSTGGTTIQLQFALTRPYDLSGKVQLVRVPEYDSAMVCGITCLPWNGTVGGVLALEVQNQLTLSGNLDVSGRGFRGGIVEPNNIPWVFGEQQFFYPPQSTLAAQKGEGIVLIPIDFSFGRGRAGNGGGGGNAHNGGGGGGANGGSGGNGGLEITIPPSSATPNTSGIGGQKYFDAQNNKVILGGGAGAGHANDELGTSGGTGGGIVFVSAGSIQTNNFRILANGMDVFGGSEQNDGQGGGGAGGTVVLQLGPITGTLNCELKGGSGGSNPYTPQNQVHGPGGGGGGGKLLLAQNTPNVVSALQGGANGFSSLNLTNGATPGEWGKMLVGFALPSGTEPAHPVSNNMLLAVQSPLCSGMPNGQISILQSTALAFRLNNGAWQSDSIFSNLAPGTYQIDLQFSGGCILDTTAVLVAAPPVLDALLSLANAGCAGGGHIEVAAVSGTAPFEFQMNGGTWQPNGLFSNLFVGSYSITLRDAAGCTHTSVYAVNGTEPALDSLLSIGKATCISGGNISVVGVSGIAPFEFQINGGAWQPSGFFQNLPAGSYSITLRDNTGCMHTSNYSVPTPPPALDSLLSLAEATCVAGGEILVSAVSGTQPFEYQINGGPWQPSGIFQGLPAGSYLVSLRDSAGCTDSGNYTVGSAPPVQVSLTSIAPATCIAGGNIAVSAVSGTAPFEFQINGGAWQPSGVFQGLPAGNYLVSLRDSAGCMDSGNYIVGAAPPAQVSLAFIAPATCIAGGNIAVSAVSGTTPFEFQINGGPWQPSGVFQGLPAGSYLVSLRDSAGCTDLGNYVVGSTPPVQVSLLSIAPATCVDGGKIAVSAVSGTAPFEFQINGGPWQPNGVFQDLPAGNYLVSLRDSAGCTDSGNYMVGSTPPAQVTLASIAPATCVDGGNIAVSAVSGTAPFEFQINGGPWQPSGVFQDLPAGSYHVSLRDSAGCTDFGDYVVGSTPLAQDSLLSLVGATCVEGGAISVTAVSGTAPFEFQINGGPWQSSGFFQDLPAGNYLVSLRDSAGCTDSGNYAVGSTLPAQESLVSLARATCVAGGNIVVTAVSGTAPFEFQINGGPWQSSGVFQDLPAGNYLVSMRDSAGCMDSGNYVVGSFPTVLDSLVSNTVETCITGGAISVAAVSGTAPFEFQINGGPWQPNGFFQDLPAGSYLVSLRDSAGCTDSNHYIVGSSPPALDSLVSIEPPTCLVGGVLLLTAVSGTAPFEFQINGGPWQPSGLFSDLPAGNYSVALRDAAGCTHQSSFHIEEEEPLLLRLDSIGNVDCRHPFGFVAVSATGGLGNYAYQIDQGSTQNLAGYFSGLTADVYAATVTDSVGCEATIGGLEVFDLIDSALTKETVTIYEGTYYQLPDGRNTAVPGQYPFHYETAEGCDSLHLIDLIVLKRHIYVPNVFLPGDKGLNNFFTVYADESLENVPRLAVYDRWGELVFEKENLLPNDEENGWDGRFRGRPVNPGVFVWVAQLKFKDGLAFAIKGNVTVVR